MRSVFFGLVVLVLAVRAIDDDALVQADKAQKVNPGPNGNYWDGSDGACGKLSGTWMFFEENWSLKSNYNPPRGESFLRFFVFSSETDGSCTYERYFVDNDATCQLSPGDGNSGTDPRFGPPTGTVKFYGEFVFRLDDGFPGEYMCVLSSKNGGQINHCTISGNDYVQDANLVFVDTSTDDPCWSSGSDDPSPDRRRSDALFIATTFNNGTAEKPVAAERPAAVDEASSAVVEGDKASVLSPGASDDSGSRFSGTDHPCLKMSGTWAWFVQGFRQDSPNPEGNSYLVMLVFDRANDAKTTQCNYRHFTVNNDASCSEATGSKFGGVAKFYGKYLVGLDDPFTGARWMCVVSSKNSGQAVANQCVRSNRDWVNKGELVYMSNSDSEPCPIDISD